MNALSIEHRPSRTKSNSDRGSTLIEYAMIFALLAVAGILAGRFILTEVKARDSALANAALVKYPRSLCSQISCP